MSSGLHRVCRTMNQRVADLIVDVVIIWRISKSGPMMMSLNLMRIDHFDLYYYLMIS